MATSERDGKRRASISACVIACDEAECLPDCLASISFCDEIVLVDSGSSDATVEIARAAGARVIEQPWLGFPAQRNVALEHAGGEWALEIDADERVSAPLRAEIERFLADPPPGIELGALPYRELFLGRRLGPSAKYPKYFHRLFKRDAYRHDEARTVHEGLIPDGPVYVFEAPVEHLLAGSWREAIGDAWGYARLEAAQIEVPLSAWSFVRGAFLRPCAKLAYRLFVDGGWRDGALGFARITLDCATDSLVWMRYLLRGPAGQHGRSGVRGDAHYGRRELRRGCIRVVAVAAGPKNSARARQWLSLAGSLGADVALLSDAPGVGAEVRARRLPRLGPFSLIRALDAESRIRPVDAVLAFGPWAALLLRVVPRGLRGPIRDIGQESDPRTIEWRERPRSS